MSSWKNKLSKLRIPSFGAVVALTLITLQREVSAQTVLTVREAEFRNRWAGQMVDRELTPQYFEPDGGLGNQGETAGPDKWNVVENIDRLARNIDNGLRYGPLDFSLGLGTGWQYSNQNSVGTNTNAADNNSFFISPSLGTQYERQIGVWSVNARYSAGYTYYFNQDYTAAGSGSQRNPLFMTAGLDIGYDTSRTQINLTSAASWGPGYDVIAGANNWQTSVSAGLSARYIVTDEISVGAAASASFSNNADAQVAPGEAAQPNNNSASYSASVFADWLVTPKTNARFVLSAGEDVQNFLTQYDSTEGRGFIDAKVVLTYQIAPKFSVDAGAGAGYVEDQNIPDAEFVGWRPVWQGAVNYTPTEKTYFKASASFQGTDIRPNFSLVAGWNAREKTRLSLSLYQNQGFSSLSPDQWNLVRGIMGTVSQRLFKGVDISFSGGWEQSQYIGMSTASDLPAPIEGPSDYWLANASLFWRIREWLSWQNSLNLSTGYGNNDGTATWFTTSLNLNF
jgi:hypothetical protein